MEFLVAVYFGRKLTNKDVVRLFYIMIDGAPLIESFLGFKIKKMSKEWKFPGDDNSFNNFWKLKLLCMRVHNFFDIVMTQNGAAKSDLTNYVCFICCISQGLNTKQEIS